jgi:uncharacterized membrane protein YedE/YeeE
MVGLVCGMAFGYVVAWAHLADPDVIRDMLLLREPDVFLLMGSAVVVASLGARLLRGAGARALLSGEPIEWDLVRPEFRHVAGSVLFGIGWGVAGTCPGPAAVMIGEGRLTGLFVVAGLLLGVVLQNALELRWKAVGRPFEEPHRAAGL